jgi:hypothetical protein
MLKSHCSLLICLTAASLLTACNKPTSPTVSGNVATAPVAVSSDDPVQKKLQELAGAQGRNCGVIKSQAPAEMDPASKCAMDSSKNKQAFFVEYQLPGMNVAVAGDPNGKLFSVQSQEGGAGLVSEACPAELRVAPSGRVTCYAPGTFPMGAGSGSHTSMTMPTMGKSPHGAKGELPPGHPKTQQP